MAPTLDVGDYIAVNTAAYGFSEPKRGDVVVFNAPNSQEINYVKLFTTAPEASDWLVDPGINKSAPLFPINSRLLRLGIAAIVSAQLIGCPPTA
ncbi:MAG: S26 family signal peptidase [Pseudomonadaceae bacterium]|nr:S26 family signal peptidase [Pseudomonadaceae bacterium]